ncbi:hypothetical protein [Membranihabitans maritimus]|uniref:hypothetical protein n=1 Tax=Membranihabitans maritimus TaxID=2904244 RepID=UPI001F2BF133|nr:hypothetical protein [Membranihabitans maritimus]
MLDQFKGISEKEYRLLINAVSEITILIASADGTIEESEKEWAEKITKIRSYSLPEGLRGFYKDVGQTFHEDIENLVVQYKEDNDELVQNLKFQLAKLNEIFEKIEDRSIAYELYKSFLSFARHVARSTGGFLGWGAVGPKEGELIELKMIHEIKPPIADH